MTSPKTKRNISRIIHIILIWIVAGIIYSIIERGLLGDIDYLPATGDKYDFASSFISVFVSHVILGLIVGIMEIKYLNNLFVDKGFGKKILYKTLIYVTTVMVLFLLIYTCTKSLSLDANIFDHRVWNSFWAFITDFVFLSIMIYAALILAISIFYTEISDIIGSRVLINYFTGKYHTATEEERIFMFLDMKSSTTIAEKLGHVKYFDMLREYYSDLSEPIIQYSGEIYQYVGDEIVVSWKLKTGLNKNNCIQCFFAMKSALLEKAEKYQEKFGLAPTFKAGFHLGEVTTGVVGVIKKEIVFTGDVLNTTARIQGLCNKYNVDILISDDLKNLIAPDTKFNIKPLGETELRGRKKNVALFTIFEAGKQKESI